MGQKKPTKIGTKKPTGVSVFNDSDHFNNISKVHIWRVLEKNIQSFSRDVETYRETGNNTNQQTDTFYCDQRKKKSETTRQSINYLTGVPVTGVTVMDSSTLGKNAKYCLPQASNSLNPLIQGRMILTMPKQERLQRINK